MDIKMIMGNLKEVESLRYKVMFNDDKVIDSPYKVPYAQGRLLIFGAYIEDELIGAIYLSPWTYDQLYINQLFVKDEYQNHPDFHVGTSLIKYVENNLGDISDYYRTLFRTLLIDPADLKSEKIYTDLGYQVISERGTMSKRLKSI